MKKKRNKKNNRANEVHGTHGTAEEKTDKQPMSVNPAADLEQSLKSRMDVMKYRGQIRDIRVSDLNSDRVFLSRLIILTVIIYCNVVGCHALTSFRNVHCTRCCALRHKSVKADYLFALLAFRIETE
jgi:hypothetical protein